MEPRQDTWTTNRGGSILSPQSPKTTRAGGEHGTQARYMNGTPWRTKTNKNRWKICVIQRIGWPGKPNNLSHGRFTSVWPAATRFTGVSGRPPTNSRLSVVDVVVCKGKVFLSHSLRSRISTCTSKKWFLWGPQDVDCDSVLAETVLSFPVGFSNLGFHVTFYIVQFIVILFATKKTLRVSFLDTPRFDTPVVTDLGEGVRQKILTHQVFNTSIIVWGRYKGLSSIPPSPYDKNLSRLE